MKPSAQPFPRILAIILVAALLAATIGAAPITTTLAQQADCGKWEFVIENAAKEKRIAVKLIDPGSKNCFGAVALQNKTSDEWLGGGYLFDVSTRADNAKMIVGTTDGSQPTLLMSLPLDIGALPINPAEPAGVSVIAQVTPRSFSLDAAFFLMRTGIAVLVPTSGLSACGFSPEGDMTRDTIINAFIAGNWMDILPGVTRGSEVIARVLAYTIAGNFLGALRELQAVLPQFFEIIVGTVKKQAAKCVLGLVFEALVHDKAAILKIAVTFLTGLGKMGWDYFEYEGVPPKFSMAYQPLSPPTPTEIPTPQPTATLVPTEPPTPTEPPAPLSSLRGTVLEHSACKYGPDLPFLYKYGILPGTVMDAIGRDADGDWIQLQAIGGHNPCWIKGSLVKLDGDVMRLPDAWPYANGLPISPFFERITILSASGGGSGSVTVEWKPHKVRADLDTEQGIEYLIEVWTCVNGKPAFYAVGFAPGVTSGSFQVDNSCGVPTKADIIGMDKEGFSLPTNIPIQ